MPTTKCKVKFSKVQQILCTNKKTKLINLHIHLAETIALIPYSKVVFEKLVWLVTL